MKFLQTRRSPLKDSSVKAVVKRAAQTFLRFPLAILLAVAATVYCIREVHLSNEEYEPHFWYFNVIGSAYLGMLLSIALTVRAEKRGFGAGIKISLQFAVVVFAALFYFTLPHRYTQQVSIRFALYALGLHWMIACIAFSARENNGFWVFNKKLFLRILTSALYTAVLFIGFALALLAIDQLFKVHVDSKLYPDIWFALVGVFNTWFFLSDFPSGYESPAVVTDYPRGLKIFTQFVLLPILTVYLLILYAYLFRIIFTATWPYGWVSYLVLGFSVAGILAILLVWPLREEENNKWISGYSRFFYIALLPLIVMLFIAIWKRVAAYGITELRYFVLALAMWLLSMALYFLLSKRKSIRLIPLSLCVMAFLVSFGPWGAVGVSLYSQQHRLKDLLVKDKVLVNGKVAGVHEQISLDDRKEITDITRYIVEVHGYRVLQPWFRENLDNLLKDPPRHAYYSGLRRADESEALLNIMKVRPANSWTSDSVTTADDEERFFVNWRSNDDDAVIVKGYDYVVRQIQLSSMDQSDQHFRIGEQTFSCHLDSTGLRLTMTADKDAALVVDLSPVLTAAGFEKTVDNYNLPLATMTLDVENMQWAGRLVIGRFKGILKNGKKRADYLTGYLLMKRK
ncbi:MAG TPA: DUF4153 domain-containing protein [Puia sp.]